MTSGINEFYGRQYILISASTKGLILSPISTHEILIKNKMK